jgi:hypothetical protein
MAQEQVSSPALTPGPEGQFVRRVLVVAGVVALGALIWALSEIFLLVFGSVLLAVILRFVAEVAVALFQALGGGWWNRWEVTVVPTF